MSREEIRARWDDAYDSWMARDDIRALLDELEAQDRLIEQLGTALTSQTPSRRWYEMRRAALAALSTWKDRQ